MTMTSTETRPALALSIAGTHAVITGVRFSWALTCFKCRQVTHVHADGGRHRVGLNVSTSRKTVRWYYRPEAPEMPARPAVCQCGETDRPFAFMAGADAREPQPELAVMPLLDEAYTAIRERFPELVKRADAALRA